MNSLFKNLIKLFSQHNKTPLEDFVSEVFAFVLMTDDEARAAFLELLGYSCPISDFNLNTQETFPALINHLSDSRPDIILSFVNHGTKVKVFIENKVASSEGHEQLQRYADHLDVFRSKGYNTHLVYITKYYDPKETQFDCKFNQYRWSQVHQILELLLEPKQVTKEFAKFMEEQGMKAKDNFDSSDIQALLNFNKVRSMLDECMYDKVGRYFNEIIGEKSNHSTNMTQLRDHNRYIYYGGLADAYCGLGFRFVNTLHEGYVDAMVFVEVIPKSREMYLNKLTDFQLNHANSWHSALEQKWPRVVSHLSFKELEGKTGHIEVLRNWFIDRLSELKDLEIQWK